MKKNPFVLALLLALPFAAGAQTPTGLFERELFHQGENGVSTYRIPAMIETRQGVLIAVVDARRDGNQDLPNHISLVMRRSFNLGKDWEPAHVIREANEGGVGDATLLLDRTNGRVWCFFTYGPPGIGFRNSKPGTLTGPETIQIHAMSSDDQGTTWSQPIDLTPSLKKPAWQAIFATSGTDIQTESGRFLVPLVIKDEQGVVHSANAFSDDHGATWKVGELIGAGTDENHNVELPGGVILQNMRNGHLRAIAFSHDGGVTFGPVSHDPALIDPSCNAGITRYRKGNKDVLIFTNAASEKRENLTVKISYDQGKTWPVARVVNAGPSSYSTVLKLSDGSIGILYERGKQYPAEQIVFARFKLNWVTQKH